MTDKIVRDAVCTDTGFDDEARAWVTNYCGNPVINSAVTMRAELKYRSADDDSAPFEYEATFDGLTREEVGMLMSCDSVRITIEPACDGRVDSRQ